MWHKDEIRDDGHCKCHLFVGPNYNPATAYIPDRGDARLVEAQSIRERTVTVYSNNWCPHSRRSRSLLMQQHIPFTDVNFEQDRAAARQVEIWNNGYRSSPTIIIHMIMTEPTVSELERVFGHSGAHMLELTVHTTSWCHGGRITEAWLKQNHIAYKSIDIERDAEAARKVQQWNRGNLSVPTLDITLRVTEPTSDELLAALDLMEQAS